MSTPRHQPFIFFSYSRFDDKHDRGRITSFAKALQDEARFRLGDEVVVFFDRSDLQHGELWDDKIRDSLEKASVFLAIVTPNYFKSRHCRLELEYILNREKRLERTDMLIPVFYVGDVARFRQDDLGEKITERQGFEWQDLRFEPFNSLLVRKSMSKLVDRISDIIGKS
jgi:hypothetical protein